MVSIANLVDTTWLTKYTTPTESTYDQGSEFIGHDFIKSLIEEEYRITSKPSTSENRISNKTLERIHLVMGNIMRTYNIKDTYIEKYDPWSGI